MAKRKWQQEMERALEEPKGESLENKAKVRGTRPYCAWPPLSITLHAGKLHALGQVLGGPMGQARSCATGSAEGSSVDQQAHPRRNRKCAAAGLAKDLRPRREAPSVWSSRGLVAWCGCHGSPLAPHSALPSPRIGLCSGAGSCGHRKRTFIAGPSRSDGLQRQGVHRILQEGCETHWQVGAIRLV